MNIIIIGNGQIGSALNSALSEHNILHWKKDIAELTEAEIIAHKPKLLFAQPVEQTLRGARIIPVKHSALTSKHQ